MTDVVLPDVRIESSLEDAGDSTTPASCRVAATSTHPPMGDELRIWVHLPLDT